MGILVGEVVREMIEVGSGCEDDTRQLATRR